MAFLSLGISEPVRTVLVGIRFNGNGLKLMSTCTAVRLRIAVALLAEIIVGTNITVITLATENFATACHALLNEFRGIAVMKVPQNHHGSVFCSTHLVKLVVITTTKIQKSLPVIKKFTIEVFSVIIDNFERNTAISQTCDFAESTHGVSFTSSQVPVILGCVIFDPCLFNRFWYN